MNDHHQLHVYFFPLMAPGHMMPLINMARQFTRHDVKATIVLTNNNAIKFKDTIKEEQEQGAKISIRTLNFPFMEVELQDDRDNLASITSSDESSKFVKALNLLQEPLHQLLKEDKPDCIIADFFFSWATEVAGKLGIPRLIFHGAGFFPLCVYNSLVQNKPHNNIESDSETFTVPGLPDIIKVTKLQLPDYLRVIPENPKNDVFSNGRKSEHTSYGVVVNSFMELEPNYVEHYSRLTGHKVWAVGPVSLGKVQKGNKNFDKCYLWLNSKEPKSVIYICFGTLSIFSATQLYEIAMALQESRQQFVWVVSDENINGIGNEEWLPEGFETRTKDQGLLIKGWAPQALILEHFAIGGFVTHCGWNSLLEAVCAGVPMITWPISSEQFDNENLVRHVLKIGVSVGNKQWSNRMDTSRVCIKKEDIIKAMTQLLDGKESEEMRSKASKLSSLAKLALEKGGSSDASITSLLQELKSIRHRD